LRVADIVLVYQRNIYHGVEQGIFTQGDKGVLSLRQTSTDLYPGKAMVYFTRRTWVMKYLAPLDTNNPPKEDGEWLSI